MQPGVVRLLVVGAAAVDETHVDRPPPVRLLEQILDRSTKRAEWQRVGHVPLRDLLDPGVGSLVGLAPRAPSSRRCGLAFGGRRGLRGLGGLGALVELAAQPTDLVAQASDLLAEQRVLLGQRTAAVLEPGQLPGEVQHEHQQEAQSRAA